jgi:uncharacterized protein (TIGR00251 family)
MALLKVKITPRSRRNALLGWLGDELKIAITTVPEKGKANLAVEAFLADKLNLARRQVQVITGHTNPRKTLLVQGLSEAELNTQLELLLK